MEPTRIYPEELRLPNRKGVGVYKVMKDGKEMYEIIDGACKSQKKAMVLKIKSNYISIPYIIRWITPDSSSTINLLEVIAEIGCNAYIYIGNNITFFWTKSLIEAHHSYDKYSFIADSDYVYGFGNKIVAMPRKHIENLIGKSLAAELTSEIITHIATELRTHGKFESVRQEVVHDSVLSPVPFDVNYVNDIITKAQHNTGRCAIMGGRRKRTHKHTHKRRIYHRKYKNITRKR